MEFSLCRKHTAWRSPFYEVSTDEKGHGPVVRKVSPGEGEVGKRGSLHAVISAATSDVYRQNPFL